MLIAQTTQPGGFASWGPAEWVLVIGALFSGITGLIIALRGKATADTAKQTTQTLAGAVRDVATGPSGQAMPNVSPETLPTLTNIERGGTGDGGSIQ